MPALPLWGIVVLAIASALIIIGLLVCLFRCRRFPGSTVDPAEYTAKKQGFHSIVTTEATSTSNSTQEEKIAMRPTTPTPTTTTASSNSSQPCTPTTTTTSSCSILPSSAHAYSDEPLSEKHHEFDRSIKSNAPTNQSQSDQQSNHIHMSLPLLAPSTSFFADKIEMSPNEANPTFDLYSDKQANSNQSDFVSIHFPSNDAQVPSNDAQVPSNDAQVLSNDAQGDTECPAVFYDTIKSTLRQSVCRKKSPTKNIHINQLFESTSNHSSDNVSPTQRSSYLPSPASQQASPPAPHQPTCMEENAACSPPSNLVGNPNIDLSSPPFRQSMDPISQKEPADVVIGMESVRTVESRPVLEYNIDTMFAWPSTEGEYDDDDGDSDEDEGDKRQSISSVLQNNKSGDDTMSITSGSVHRLVRDSTVVDTDHRSLAARSIANSIRPSLHDMASWWPKEDPSVDQKGADHTRSQSPMMISSNQSISSSSITTKSTSKASIYTSSPKSTFSRATLNKFRIALANEESDEEEGSIEDHPAPEDNEFMAKEEEEKEKDAPSMAPPPAFMDTDIESPPPPPPLSSSPVSPVSPPSLFKGPYREDNEEPSISTRPTSTISAVSNQSARLISPIPELEAAPTAGVAATPSSPIRSSPRNSTLGTSSGNTDSVRRVLQSTWNPNRLSDQGSIASTRTALSQGMSPPGSINPRQLNQHLASLSIQTRLTNRPGLPTGFMNEDLLIANASMGPTPTVSFSSSTVRTMIPENDPIESHVGKKKTTTATMQPKAKQQKQKQPKEMAKAATVGATKDKQSFGTMRTGRQQRGSMPWNTEAAATKPNTNKKTPAQRERDRYLQSLKS
ncbi:hypothetical protein [Absidia glauca]|uniref:Uncharacterized protein n=1 Tax=Absidia glauca TaxID=4829 RepID=A0A163J2K0_ABSGL|nr:hypothetical protein [Absidia glauca]